MFFRRRTYRVDVTLEFQQAVAAQGDTKKIYAAKSVFYEIIFNHIINPIIAPPEH